MIACCGLDCEQCKAFIATRDNNDPLRAAVAKEWAELYHAPIQPEHINCTGCHSTGAKVYYCEAMCEVRKCCTGKGLPHCAACGDFACAALQQIFSMSAAARQNLMALRK